MRRFHLSRVLFLIFVWPMWNGNVSARVLKHNISPAKKEVSGGFTIINNSKDLVFFQVFAAGRKGGPSKYATATSSVSPSAVLKYRSASEMQWSGEMPKPGYKFTFFKGTYSNESGGCTSEASNYIGSSRGKLARLKFGKEATINTAKCGGSGALNLLWSEDGNNIIVTIK